MPIYTGDNNVVILGLNYPDPYMEPGDTFTLKLTAAGLLTGTDNSTARLIVCIDCKYNTISPANERQYCGA